MFKKPLSNLKTSAPLRSSDRRKLKQRVISTYSLTAEEGDALVPDGILSLKFSTHVDEPGVRHFVHYLVVERFL
jgi:translation initiation factor 2D